jgi:hypothetical protein
MKQLQQVGTNTEVTPEQRTKAAGRRYRRQQSAFDILVIFVVLQLISIIYSLINPNAFAFNSLEGIS